jgi:hypothetical protein
MQRERGIGREEGELLEKGRGREASPEPPPPDGSRLRGRSAKVMLTSVLFLARDGTRSSFRAFLSGEPRKLSREGGHKSEPALELYPLSTPKFHCNPNTGIRSTEYQNDDSKPSFLHPNRPLDKSERVYLEKNQGALKKSKEQKESRQRRKVALKGPLGISDHYPV